MTAVVAWRMYICHKKRKARRAEARAMREARLGMNPMMMGPVRHMAPSAPLPEWTGSTGMLSVARMDRPVYAVKDERMERVDAMLANQ